MDLAHRYDSGRAWLHPIRCLSASRCTETFLQSRGGGDSARFALCHDVSEQLQVESERFALAALAFQVVGRAIVGICVVGCAFHEIFRQGLRRGLAGRHALYDLSHCYGFSRHYSQVGRQHGIHPGEGRLH